MIKIICIFYGACYLSNLRQLENISNVPTSFGCHRSPMRMSLFFAFSSFFPSSFSPFCSFFLSSSFCSRAYRAKESSECNHH